MDKFWFSFRYLFPFEDLSKKLGSMTIPSAYYGGRTSTNNDSRRSLIRVRRQSEEKHKSKQISTPIKQQVYKNLILVFKIEQI